MEARESQRRKSCSYRHDLGKMFKAVDWYVSRELVSVSLASQSLKRSSIVAPLYMSRLIVG